MSSQYHLLSEIGLERATLYFDEAIEIKKNIFLMVSTLKSLISMEFFLFFLRKNSQLHALLEPPRLFDFGKFSYLCTHY